MIEVAARNLQEAVGADSIAVICSFLDGRGTMVEGNMPPEFFEDLFELIRKHGIRTDGAS